MEKNRQKVLTHWLKQQSVISHRQINASRLLGLIGSLLIIAQAWLMTYLLHHIIIETISCEMLLLPFVMLILIIFLRLLLTWQRERIEFHTGQHICCEIRRQVLNRLEEAGPTWILKRQAGNWSTLILEQIDNLHDYYARYLPHLTLAVCIPLLIVIAILPINWVAALILLLTAPLIPMFMIQIGMGAEDANQRNFLALSRLSGHFLDRLRGIETLRVFGRGETEIKNIYLASQDFRQRTMEVLRLAFLSSGVLEFFTSLSIAIIAVYFGFSYLGVFDFGHYNTIITLFSGFFTLILAPEFFQPLRDFGTLYHAKAQAIGAAENLKAFFEIPLVNPVHGEITLNNEPLTLVAKDFSVLSLEGIVLAGPLNFTLSPGQRVVIIGSSGSGKSSLLNALSGFLPYNGSLQVNGIELRSIKSDVWRTKLSWVGQNPYLPATTLRDNVLLGCEDACEEELKSVLDRSWVSEFLPLLSNQVDTVIGVHGEGLSVGQAQRVAVARALLRPCFLLLLDEPASNLDVYSEQRVMQALDKASRKQTTLMVTHQLDSIVDWDDIWVMDNGRIVEQGNFSTLIASQGYLASFLSSRQEKI